MQANNTGMSNTSFTTAMSYSQNPNVASFLPMQASNLIGSPQANMIQTSIMHQQQQQQQQQQNHQAPAQKDTTFTKIFVGGLPYHTTDESLKSFFQKFGNIEEAVVITDRQNGKSRGYGFVTMESREAAETALLDANPIIDGRKANINLAYLGVKSKLIAPTNFFPMAIRCQLPMSAPETAVYGFQPLYYPTANPNANFLSQSAGFLSNGQNLLLTSPSPQMTQIANGLNNSALIDLSSAYTNALNSNRTSPFENPNHLSATNPAAMASNPFIQFNNSPFGLANTNAQQTFNPTAILGGQTQPTNSYLALPNTLTLQDKIN